MMAPHIWLTLCLGSWALPAAAAELLLVIDDIGNNRLLGEQLLALPAPVNMAFLPHTPFAASLAAKAAAQGHTVMLHAPMATESGVKLGPGGLYPTMDKATLSATLNADLDAIPAVSGLNNHMGSLLTQDCERMSWVMDIARQRQLFFIDSRTTAATCARQAALQAGVPVLARDVFLDNDRSAAALAQQFDKAITLANQHGQAVLIGHPYPETIQFLQQRLRPTESRGWHLAALHDKLAPTAAQQPLVASKTDPHNSVIHTADADPLFHHPAQEMPCPITAGQPTRTANTAKGRALLNAKTLALRSLTNISLPLARPTPGPAPLTAPLTSSPVLTPTCTTAHAATTKAEQSIGVLRLPESHARRVMRVHLQP
ncbi:divergent polysaccharide deacetylase family protein [Oceanobacter sp. 5_MG-2023]|uniref:divergent polysaccharide deacetylase family protein n=1 Tax=Oceanobacter sp. 5_MG-2023 TaxID=3062645 RepID=UPI0026E3FB28|nr:divergent polysaccharide deacetylase family protein [Oceanobacter sp. 5_MG-2023]MDO6681892.1 divergent polysaccharide deacetylase family protein [Oceanobacter sp. 5_MG-2023]